MMYRCHKEGSQAYPRYGAKGIVVCPEWHNYAYFYEWAMANGYADNLTIERKKNELGYNPENCEWITKGEQNANRTNTRYIEAFGESKTINDWIADPRCSVSKECLAMRIDARGWDAERAISTPKLGQGAPVTRL